MDRNCITAPPALSISVALRKESVDRNFNDRVLPKHCFLVALRKESVDRNNTMQIKIIIMYAVALRKESVDRNRWGGLVD